MSEALKAMVAAMIAEMRGQKLHGKLPWVDDEFGPEDVTLDGQFDMQKVARAGLAAIREPTDAMVRGAERKPLEVVERDIWRAMVDEILKDDE